MVTGGKWHLFEIFKSIQLTVKISLAMNGFFQMWIGIRREQTPLLLDIFEMVSCGMFFVRALDLAGHGLKCTENRNIRGCQGFLPNRRNQKHHLNDQPWCIPSYLSMCGNPSPREQQRRKNLETTLTVKPSFISPGSPWPHFSTPLSIVGSREKNLCPDEAAIAQSDIGTGDKQMLITVENSNRKMTYSQGSCL